MDFDRIRENEFNWVNKCLRFLNRRLKLFYSFRKLDTATERGSNPDIRCRNHMPGC